MSTSEIISAPATPDIKIHSKCRVCNAPSTRHFLTLKGKKYQRCENCMATLLDPDHWLLPEEEFKLYRKHNNDSTDKGYQKFLSRLAKPLLEKLIPSQNGLDYGCGPGPVLAGILSDAGHNMCIYDPFFYPDQSVLEQTYDFITCTETIEHFHRPAVEFTRFDQMLRPGGWLGIMTCFQTNDDRFSSWHYRRDPTHVAFYQETTLRHIAAKYNWSCEIPVKNVALMQKPPGLFSQKETRVHAQ